MTAVIETSAQHDISAFAHLGPFRAAEAEELINVANPFRRPVRPDDLNFLRYDTAITAQDASSLKLLIGHRILLNANEVDVRFHDSGQDRPGVEADRSAFVSDEATILAGHARGALEPLMFAPLRDAFASRPGHHRDAGAAESALRHTITGLSDPHYAFTYLLIQESCLATMWKTVLTRTVSADDVAGDHAYQTDLGLIEASRTASERQRWLAELMSKWGLTPAARAYWQFYLPSTLTIANHLYWATRPAAAQDGRAALHTHLTHQAQRDMTLRRIASALGTSVDAPPTVTVQPPRDAEPHHVADALWRVRDNELDRQIRWADDLDFYLGAASRLQQIINDRHLEIDLDTFVETDSETSTTHVHDDHRLVVIESGAMEFWNNAGRTIHMTAGDKLLIPRGGAVCTGRSCDPGHAPTTNQSSPTT